MPKTFDIILSPAKYKQTPEIINNNKEKTLKKGLNDKKRDFIIITDPQSSLHP
jgi:hypothetical protein